MIILAPMQGLTELPFRKAYFRTFGNAVDCAVSPFLSLTHGNLCTALKKISDVLPENNVGSIPVTPQILGSEIREFVDLANRLADFGFSEVNWNIGCPMPRVARKTRGSGILPYPELVEEVLEQVCSKTKVEISVKMRLGYSDENEIFALVPVLNAFPLKSVTIHPRTGVELYGGDLHLDCLKRALPLIRHKVVFNGEIKTADDYDAVRTRFPEIEDFMIGRGVVANPILPLEIKHIPVSDAKAAKFRFFEALCSEIRQLPTIEKSKENKIKEYWQLMLQDIRGVDAGTLKEPLLCTSFSEACRKMAEILKG